MDLVLFLALTLASFRITRFITRDAITSFVREHFPPTEKTDFAYLIRCDWCAGIYVSAAVVAITNLFFVDFAVPILIWLAIAGGLGLLASWEGE